MSLILSTGNFASAEVKSTEVVADFNSIVLATDSLFKTDLRGKTLFVFDIDNTTLKTTVDLGSEHWFLWQKGLLDSGQLGVPAVTNSVDSLLRIQSWIYEIGSMEPVDSKIPEFLKEIQTFSSLHSNVYAIALTSRTLFMRDSTHKEFAINNLKFSTEKVLGLPDYGGPYLPYDLNDPVKSGLSHEDIASFKLPQPQLVSFENGVLFTQGQHKGIMLKLFLARLKTQFSNIVFIDDRPHHIAGMNQVFNVRTEKLYSYQFVKAKSWIDGFNQSDKSTAQNAWCALSKGLATALVSSKNLKLNLCETNPPNE